MEWSRISAITMKEHIVRLPFIKKINGNLNFRLITHTSREDKRFFSA